MNHANPATAHFRSAAPAWCAPCLALAVMALTPRQVCAEDLQGVQALLANSESSPVPAGWTVGGVGYRGSSVYKDGPQTSLPIPGAIYIGQDFMFLGDRAFYTFARQDRLSFFGRARLRLGNLDPKDAAPWAGMSKRQAQLELGLGAGLVSELGLWTARLSSDVSGRSNGHEFLLNWSAPLVRKNWMLMPGLGLVWRQDKLSNYYFGGVSALEARPGRPAYDTGHTWSVLPSVLASYRVSPRWLVGAVVSAELFSSGIKDSPLVQKKGRYDLLLGVGYVWP